MKRNGNGIRATLAHIQVAETTAKRWQTMAKLPEAGVSALTLRASHPRPSVSPLAQLVGLYGS
jgi:hypothetical protein